MKLALTLLLCCISASLQQQSIFWDWPSWLPFYPNSSPDHYGYQQPTGSRSGLQQPVRPQFRSNQEEKDAAIDFLKMLVQEKKPESKIQGRNKVSSTNAQSDRAFGAFKLLGFDYLANYVLNSLSLTTTSTTYSTTTSTLTIGTIVTCYTSSMFKSTTACRRKKNVMLPNAFRSTDDISDPIVPSQVEPLEASAIAPLIREERSVESDVDIASSHEDELAPFAYRLARQAGRTLFEETLYVTTATITTYSLYTTSATKTVTGLGATTVLSCLPSGFTLC